MKTTTYGFTTTPDDAALLRRIAKEAKPKDQFLITTIKNTTNNESVIVIFVRESVIPPFKAGFELLGQPFCKDYLKWGDKLKGTDFYMGAQVVDNPRKATNIALNEIQRIKNFLHGRVVRVRVQAA